MSAAAGHALRLCFRTCRQVPVAATSASPRVGTPLRHSIVQRRAFTTTQTRWARDGARGEEGDDHAPSPYNHLEDAFEDLSPEQLKTLEEIVREGSAEGEALTLTKFLESEEPELRAGHSSDPEDKVITARAKINRRSFWYDEDDPDTITEDVGDEFDENDITSMAHGKLDEIREYRHYARVAVWEMPLLAKLAKPFEPPTSDQVLRFRYTTYMGESHPAEKKVVVQFSPSDLDLTPVQREKLRKLAGPRLNPQKDIIKMSCESFDHAAQNKRYLSELVDKLVAAAKDPSDTFEDIPLDTRHHKVEKKPKFPKEWRMTPERKKELASVWKQAMLVDAGKAAEAQLTEGDKAKEHEAVTKETVAELLAAQRGPTNARSGRERAF
ncbi:37S ribosomal protein S24 [Sodiomyces alkalinus F11]|uniref:37S ribosomal protein S24 n=1 Tax=Sodiomyces alkalinus (strain CBS 110278 / VKM F-3762 / F11) TaxID=1314773 RepID=A0A3N2PM84_SODAK|nr:37S ribosomal protein S24 [Sodiomyces alkalinus F11]ROT35642.1 37S ribosomal protein S24 [Sodiomyces alkalinus F11]